MYILYRDFMTTKLSAWGNSLGIRLPKVVAEHASLSEGSLVEFVLKADGSVLIRPAEPSLEELVSRITPQNRHEETDWGTPVGKERG
jgi:antitoxin MazE